VLSPEGGPWRRSVQERLILVLDVVVLFWSRVETRAYPVNAPPHRRKMFDLPSMRSSALALVESGRLPDRLGEDEGELFAGSGG
jgi:hypothetical protein